MEDNPKGCWSKLITSTQNSASRPVLLVILGIMGWRGRHVHESYTESEPRDQCCPSVNMPSSSFCLNLPSCSLFCCCAVFFFFLFCCFFIFQVHPTRCSFLDMLAVSFDFLVKLRLLLRSLLSIFSLVFNI